jgi:uncharacterized membrane protein affecting hemolysin expression
MKSYRILRIAIVFVLLFCLWNCSEKQKEWQLHPQDKEQLSVIGNMINEDIQKADELIDALLRKASSNNDILLKANAYLKRGILLTKKGEFINARDTLISGVNMIKNRGYKTNSTKKKNKKKLEKPYFSTLRSVFALKS